MNMPCVHHRGREKERERRSESGSGSRSRRAFAPTLHPPLG